MADVIPQPAKAVAVTQKLISPFTSIRRKHGTWTTGATGSGQQIGPVNLLTGLMVRKLSLHVNYTVTFTGATAVATAAMLTGTDGWGMIQNVDIVVNGSYHIRTLTGQELYWLATKAMHKPARWGWTFGTGVGPATATFDGVLDIPFAWPDLIRPVDTMFDARPYSGNGFTAQVNTGAVANVFSTQPAGTTAASVGTVTVDVLGDEADVAVNGFKPKYTVRIAKFPMAANYANGPQPNPAAPLVLTSNEKRLAYYGFLFHFQNTANPPVDVPSFDTYTRIYNTTRQLFNEQLGLFNRMQMVERSGEPNFYQGASPLQGSGAGIDNTDAWVWVPNSPDGLITGSIDAATAGTVYIDMATSAAGNITVYPVELLAA